MFGFRFMKAMPHVYVMHHERGKLKREGLGLSFFYYAPFSSLVAISQASQDAPFMFSEVTGDYQEVTIQGQITYRINDPARLASLMNYSLNAKGKYVSEDPSQLADRLLNRVQVALKGHLAKLALKATLNEEAELSQQVKKSLESSGEPATMGLELLGLSILAIKPRPETARALEADVRENLLRVADEAAYQRRNAAVDQERTIQQNEIATEVATTRERGKVRETLVEAERVIKQMEARTLQEEILAQTQREKKKQELVELAAENTRREAEAKAYGLKAMLESMSGTDVRVLQALAGVSMDADRLVALGFRDLAEGAAKIGQLNITPDLLGDMMQRKANERGKHVQR